MMSFLKLKPTAFGLDISDLSLKVVQLKKKGKFFDLASYGETRMKPGVIEQGDIKDEKALSENIKKAIKDVRGEKIRTKYVVISLPEEKAFLQVIQLPLMKEEDVKKAVYFEAENYIPLPIEKVYLDSQIISCDAKNKKLNVLIAAIPRTIIDLYVGALKGAGLKPVVLEIESMSISRALVGGKMPCRPLILIDLGENRAGFSIYFDNSLRFTTTHQSVCAKKFTEEIVESLKIDFKEAEALKLKNGLVGSKNGKKNLDIFTPILNELADLTEKYINYCEKQYGQKIEKILLCGGGSNLKGLNAFLGKYFQIPVELGDPWVNIINAQSKKAKPLTPEESLRYTTALGLALRGASL